jgi:alkylhydroperoxidase family enzyme
MRARSYRPELTDAIQDVYRSITVRQALDPITTELVRLRCARTLNCRLCQSVRLATAARAGLGDDETDKIDDYENSDLSEHHKVALRLADAFIADPTSVGPELKAGLERYFTPQERMELVLDLTAWLNLKTAVPLLLDIPPDLEHTTFLHYDDAGNPIVGGTSAASEASGGGTTLS